MPTQEAVGQVYDEFELAVPQAHLDMYRALPEVTSLTCFSLVHRGHCETACHRLVGRGMMTVTPYDGEEIKDTIDDDPKHPDYQTAVRASHKRHDNRFGKSVITYVKEALLPGVRGKLTENANEEMLRLYKAGTLKKNDF